jgi:HEAT repeat protein
LLGYVRRIRLLPPPSVPDVSNDRMPVEGLAKAAEALGRQGDPRSVPLLVELLDHDARRVVGEAIAALGRFDAIDAAADALLAEACSQDQERATVAIQALAEARSPRVMHGLRELASGCRLDNAKARVTVKTRAAAIVAAADPAALREVLQHSDREGRAAAARVIRDRQGPESLVSALVPLLADGESVAAAPSGNWSGPQTQPLRDLAAAALVAIGSPEALAALANRAHG